MIGMPVGIVTNLNLTKECDCMKKLITLVLALVCVLGLVGCNQKAVSASEVYSFPEPTTMITVSFYSQGEETAFEIVRTFMSTPFSKAERHQRRIDKIKAYEENN